MIKKLIFGFIWFAVIFAVIYTIGGVIFVYLTGGPQAYQTPYAASLTYRSTYIGYIVIGSLVLAIIGAAAGILPGTKRKSSKKARKKGKR